MSKEDALRFMIIQDKDQIIANEISIIMDKYEVEKISKDEWDMVIMNEIIPSAKRHGFTFTIDEFKQVQKPATGKLSDEELGEVTGGQGQIVLTFRNRYNHIFTYKAYCDFAPDDETFRRYYDTYPTNCPNYVWSGNDYNSHSCARCVNCRLGE